MSEHFKAHGSEAEGTRFAAVLSCGEAVATDAKGFGTLCIVEHGRMYSARRQRHEGVNLCQLSASGR